MLGDIDKIVNRGKARQAHLQRQRETKAEANRQRGKRK